MAEFPPFPPSHVVWPTHHISLTYKSIAQVRKFQRDWLAALGPGGPSRKPDCGNEKLPAVPPSRLPTDPARMISACHPFPNRATLGADLCSEEPGRRKLNERRKSGGGLSEMKKATRGRFFQTDDRA